MVGQWDLLFTVEKGVVGWGQKFTVPDFFGRFLGFCCFMLAFRQGSFFLTEEKLATTVGCCAVLLGFRIL